MNIEKTKILVRQFDSDHYQVIVNNSVPIIYSGLNSALDWVFKYYDHDNALITIDTREAKK